LTKCREWQGRHGSTGGKSAGDEPGGIGIGGKPGKPTPAGRGPVLGEVPDAELDEKLDEVVDEVLENVAESAGLLDDAADAG